MGDKAIMQLFTRHFGMAPYLHLYHPCQAQFIIAPNLLSLTAASPFK